MENENLNAICEYLWYNKIFFYRNHNTPIYDFQRKCYRKMGKWTRAGVADIVGIYKGKPLYIEVKQKGKYASKEQKEFIAEVIEHGGIAFVASDIDEVKKQLKTL